MLFMTTPEHTLVGIHTAIALGVYARCGWKVVTLAGVASNLPDWDGLPMLFDMAQYESGHRVWGHNLFSIALLSTVVAWAEYRYGLIEWAALRLRGYLPKELSIERTPPAVSFGGLWLVCCIAQVIHLPCDMVVSGGSGLSDWHIKPLWPLVDTGYVFPLIPWGDIGPTLILMGGAILLAKSPSRPASKSMATLAMLCTYLLLRGTNCFTELLAQLR